MCVHIYEEEVRWRAHEEGESGHIVISGTMGAPLFLLSKIIKNYIYVGVCVLTHTKRQWDSDGHICRWSLAFIPIEFTFKCTYNHCQRKEGFKKMESYMWESIEAFPCACYWRAPLKGRKVLRPSLGVFHLQVIRRITHVWIRHLF